MEKGIYVVCGKQVMEEKRNCQVLCYGAVSLDLLLYKTVFEINKKVVENKLDRIKYW